jgi:putative acetyltransferase
MIIRGETPADFVSVQELVTAAFQRPDEARLVDRLHSNGKYVISLVAVDGVEIVGHLLFSRMAAPFRALGLGPVSVKPHRQREGIGNQLVRMGLEQAIEGGWKGVFVVGDPKFYTRFGFQAALAKGFTSRYSGPHLMALARCRKLPTREGVIGYASAFDSLG